MTRGNGHDHHDPKVTSLEEARRRAAGKAKAAAKSGDARPARTLKDWLVGGVILALAASFVASLILPMVGG